MTAKVGEHVIQVAREVTLEALQAFVVPGPDRLWTALQLATTTNGVILAEINPQPGSREALEARYGQVWDTQQLAEDFTVVGFMAPLVGVRRMSDGLKGSLEFQHQPRFYFNFVPDTK